MFLLFSILVIAIAVGTLRGGSLTRLGEPPFRMWWLALAGLVLQVIPMPNRDAAAVALLVSYAMLGWFAWTERRRAGFALIMIGLAANFLVVAANGGMPVSGSAVERAGRAADLPELVEEGGAKHHLADGDILMPLADIIPIGSPYRSVISLGDVLIYAGIAIYVVAGMGKRHYLPEDESTGLG